MTIIIFWLAFWCIYTFGALWLTQRILARLLGLVEWGGDSAAE